MYREASGGEVASPGDQADSSAGGVGAGLFRAGRASFTAGSNMVQAQFNNLPKRRTLQTLWLVCQALIFPYCISSFASMGGQVPGELIFTLVWTALQAVALGVVGWLMLTRQSWQTPQIFGGVMASCCWMASISFNNAVDIGYFNSQVNAAVGGNVDAVRSTIAFAIFLFLTYSVVVALLWQWGDLLALNGSGANGMGSVDSLQNRFDTDDFGPNAGSIRDPDASANNDNSNHGGVSSFQAESL